MDESSRASGSRRLFGGLAWPPSLHNAPLRELLKRDVRFPRLAHAIKHGHLDALAVTASAYTSARSVTFFQARESLAPWSRVRRIGRAESITMDHLMASAAVPFVFPPVRIGGEYYGDGSMRSPPLAPAIHLAVGSRDRVRDDRPTRTAQIAFRFPASRT